MSQPAVTFFEKHEFLIRRLHSLSGIIPLGAYMCVHLLVNASLLNSTETFQWLVYQIHMPGKLLPLIEWGLILLPLLFHGILGVWIVSTGKSNTGNYAFTSNKRYKWQRITGVIALVFLLAHVFHLHGWSHAEWWKHLITPVGGGQFRAYNAASTLGLAFQASFLIPLFYLVGMLACVYHLANGLWTAGITWGLWISPAAQARATKVCTVFGIGLAIVGISATIAPALLDPEDAKQTEDRMYRSNLEGGMVPENAEKRSLPDPVLGTEAAPHDGNSGTEDIDGKPESGVEPTPSDVIPEVMPSAEKKTEATPKKVDETEVGDLIIDP